MNDSEKSSLVQQKKELNETVSRTVDTIFDAKDAWNGKPAPDIGVTEEHSITEPIPQEAIDAFQEATDKINGANNKLKQISEEQSGQSQRKKEKKDQGGKGGEPPLDLSSIASSAPSRFMAHLKAPMQFGDPDKWARLKLLRASSSIKSHLEELSEHILSTKELSIPKAIYKAKDLFYIYDNELFTPIKVALLELPEKVEKPEEKEEVQEPDFEESVEDQAHQQEVDTEYYQYHQINNILNDDRNELELLKNSVPSEIFNKYKIQYNDIIRKIRFIKSLLKVDFEKAHEEFLVLRADIDNLYNLVQFEKGTLQKEANKFTRFLKEKKLKHLTPSSSHQKPIRLKANANLKAALNNLNDLMNALEKKGIKPSSLSSYVKKINSNISALYESLYRLGDIYNSEVKVKQHKAKRDRSRVDVSNIQSIDLTSLLRMNRALNEMSKDIEKLRGQRV